jgi:UDP-N-acetyl-2-amino-2-deoxyglucuronate dehydrogenase
MSNPLKFGIIGCGIIAPSHVESLQALDGVSVEWACDLVAGKAKQLAARYHIPRTCTDYREVMTDPAVDCICVCTDHASHVPITVSALEHDKHVLCEKALAASTAGLDAMMAAHAQRPHLTFGGVFQHRFDPDFRYLKELVDAGQFGQILTAGVQVRCLRTDQYYRADTWRGTWQEEGGSVLINQAIHFIDTLQWIAGEVSSVCGAHANLTHGDAMETEDTAVASLKFASGALGTVEATCSSHLDWEPTILIHGTEGSIELRDGVPLKLRFADSSRAEAVLTKLREYRECQNEISAGKSYYGSGHFPQIVDFVEAVRDQRPLYVTAKSARRTVDLVLAIYRSHKAQAWVSV